jgi:hypothetical protein
MSCPHAATPIASRHVAKAAARSSIRVGGNEMAAGVERVVDGGMSGQEALR